MYGKCMEQILNLIFQIDAIIERKIDVHRKCRAQRALS